MEINIINIIPKCQHHALDTLAEFVQQISGFFAKTQLADSQVCSVASFGADPVPSQTGAVSTILMLMYFQVGGSNIWLNGRTPAPSAFSLL